MAKYEAVHILFRLGTALSFVSSYDSVCAGILSFVFVNLLPLAMLNQRGLG